MADDPQKHDENSLEDVAAEASAQLADDVAEVNQTSKDRVQAGQVQMNNSSARLIEAHAVHMEDSAAGTVRGGSLEIKDSAVGFVLGESIRVQESTVSFVAGKHVQADQATTVLLVAGKSEGNIRAMLTPLTAAAFGAGFGIVWFVLSSVARRLISAKRQTKTE